MPIRVNLDRVLLERRMSLTELADRVGVTIANLSILKTGKARAVRFSTLAALCREVLGDTVLKYTKPTTRLTGHMAGYDPTTAPTFEWPERLQKAHAEIMHNALERSRSAGAGEIR